MKPLETIIAENEYVHIAFWADKYVDLVGQMRPQNAADTLKRIEENPTAESEEIKMAIKENGTDTIMYPFYRSLLIGHGLLTEEEVEKHDLSLERIGRPCSTPEQLEATKDGILTTMIDSKNRILNMNEEDSLYGMYTIHGGDILRSQIVATQSHMFEQSFMSDAAQDQE